MLLIIPAASTADQYFFCVCNTSRVCRFVAAQVDQSQLSEPLFVFNSGLHEDAQLTPQIFLLLVFIPKDESAAILWLSWSLPLLESNITVCCYRSQTVIITTWSRGLLKHLLLISSAIFSCLQRSAPVKSWLSKVIFISSHSSTSGSMYLCTSRYYFCHTVKSTLYSYHRTVIFIYSCMSLLNSGHVTG